jgi:Leucine-rich repeat (LRR) protein
MNDSIDPFRERIERARREKSTRLDLSHISGRGALEEIPLAVFELTHLQSLDVSGQAIRIVPERIRELVNLKYVNLTGNPLESLPDVRGLQLDWSTYRRCRSTVSPENVDAIDLDIDDSVEPQVETHGAELAREITTLPNLRTLTIVLRRPDPVPPSLLRSFFDQIENLERLESLRLFGIPLRELPVGLRRLERLQTLWLEEVGIETVPEWLGELKELKLLGLGWNALISLPHSLERLKKLKALFASGNEFSEITPQDHRACPGPGLARPARHHRRPAGPHPRLVPAAEIREVPPLQLSRMPYAG